MARACGKRVTCPRTHDEASCALPLNHKGACDCHNHRNPFGRRRR